ncbi:MAG TPA: alginate lyase family protein [Thermodesulfobacteriota bacterium]|nr:alginate lyase family protein [Thermodesulfobacteriota bacterium]
MNASSISWKLNRLRSMSLPELFYRTRQSLRGFAEGSVGLGLARETPPRGSPGARWLPRLPNAIDPVPYVTRADSVLAGRFTLFALRDLDLGFPPQWNRDPKTGVVVPLVFGKAIDYRDEQLVGDIKYLWELNRHLDLVTLAQAWHLTGESRFFEGCRALLDSWFVQCPYPLGPNWTSSLEHGLRLVNWAFAWQLLGGESSGLFEDDLGQVFRQRWLRSVHQHCHFIKGHLSRYSSANNHLMGELMGLLVGSLTWPMWSESKRWRDFAHREFAEQAMLQTTDDGVNREQAIYYHHEVMDMMLVCGLVTQANGVDFDARYWERLEHMAEFVAALMDRAGNVPMIGDADDARIVRLDPSDAFDPYRSLLSTTAVLFERGDLKAKAGVCDDKTVWLLGESANELFDALPATSDYPLPWAFPEGGYYLFGARRGEPTEILACVDCGPIGYLSISGHGHADALSMTLSAGGVPLLIDPGTFAYHTQRGWRDYFRSTFAHNTVCVDGQDQSVSGGSFMWLDKATSRCIVAEWSETHQRFVGEHDGYCRLADPVVHRRSIDFDVSLDEFIVEDLIDCRGNHEAQLCWHFSEHCDVTVTDAVVHARIGNVTLKLAVEGNASPPKILRGQINPPAGWISRSYDTKLPSATAMWNISVQGPTRFTTLLTVGFR